MDEKKLKLMCYVGGILTVAFYLIFLFIAWGLFPNPASPLDHWLSDFGRFEIPADGGPVWRYIDGSWKEFTEITPPILSRPNPAAIIYDLGCILAGGSMFLFFTGFLAYTDKEDKTSKLLTYALMVVGYLGGVFLILVGIFTEDGIFPGIIAPSINAIHHLATMIFFIFLIGIKVLSGLWAWKHDLNRLISFYAWITIIFDIILVVTDNNFSVIEWTSVLLSLGTVAIVAIGLYLKDKPLTLNK